MKYLELIEEALLKELNPKVRTVLEVGRYIISGGGKRLRPLLTLLSCGMCGGRPEDALPLGVGLEYIHVASLLHDDVVDGAEKRRGKDSANLVFGNDITVLTGDYMYAKALHLFSTYGNIEMIRIVSSAVMDMAEAQILEISRIGDLIDEEEYFRIIEGKTAALFGACMSVGGMKAGDKRVKELYRIGIHMGRAFQLIDDLLDYTGDQKTLGKPVGNDLREGKATYPLISVADLIDKDFIRKVLRSIEPNKEDIEKLRNMVLEKGGGEKTKERAKEEINKAKELLKEFPDNEFKEEIIKILDFVVERKL